MPIGIFLVCWPGKTKYDEKTIKWINLIHWQLALLFSNKTFLSLMTLRELQVIYCSITNQQKWKHVTLVDRLILTPFFFSWPCEHSLKDWGHAAFASSPWHCHPGHNFCPPLFRPHTNKSVEIVDTAVLCLLTPCSSVIAMLNVHQEKPVEIKVWHLSKKKKKRNKNCNVLLTKGFPE